MRDWTQVFIDGERACPRCEKRAKGKGRKYCRPCHAEYMRAWRKGKPKAATVSLEERARQRANSWHSRGTIWASPVCFGCSAKGELHKHHPDYTKPLDLCWVCAECHRRIHAGEMPCPPAMPMMDAITLAMLPDEVAAKEAGEFLARVSAFRVAHGISAPA